MIDRTAFPLIVMATSALAACNPIGTRGLTVSQGYQKMFATSARQAPALRAGDPTPVWLSGLAFSDVDDVVNIPGLRVFVCTSRTEGDEVRLHYGPCLMLNSATGRVLWRYNRLDSNRYVYSVIARSPVIVIHRSGPDGVLIDALDAATGRRRWLKRLKRPPKISRDLRSGDLLILSDAGGDKRVLTLLDVHTGRARFATKVSIGRRRQAAQLLATQGRVLVVGDTLTAVALPTGKIDWRLNIGFLAPNSSPLELTNGDVILATHNRQRAARLLRVDRFGKRVWSAALPGVGRVLARGNQRIYVELPRGQSRLAAVNSTTGAVVWVRKLGGSLCSPILAAGDRVVVTTCRSGRTLRLFDVGGVAIAVKSLPASGQVLPARLQGYANHVVVQQEGYIGAFRLTNGTRLWKFYRVASGELPSTYRLRRKRLESLSAWFKGGHALDQTLRTLENRLRQPTSVATSANRLALSWRRHLQKVAAARSKGSTSPGSESWSRWASSLSRERTRLMATGNSGSRTMTKLRIVNTFNKMARRGAMLEAAGNFMTSAAKIAARIQVAKIRDAFRESVKIALSQMSFRIRMINRAADHRMAGNLAAYSFMDKGGASQRGRFGLLIVDMRNGRWSELTLGPFSFSHFVRTLNENFPTFDLKSSRLYIRGMGLDPRRWRQDIAHPNKRQRHIATGLLAYDLRRLSFSDPAQFARRLKVLDGRRGTLPRVVPGRTATSTLIRALGRPHSADVNWLRWISVIVRPDSNGVLTYLSEATLCRIRSGYVLSCRQSILPSYCRKFPKLRRCRGL